MIASSADPDEMQQTTLLGVSSIQRVLSDYQMSSIKYCPCGQKHNKSCLKPLGLDIMFVASSCGLL